MRSPSRLRGLRSIALLCKPTFRPHLTLSAACEKPIAIESVPVNSWRVVGSSFLKTGTTTKEDPGLPRNYSMSQSELGLPDVFSENSGWMEVEWFPNRSHDYSADYRRAARVFLRPATKSHKFLADVNAMLGQRKSL